MEDYSPATSEGEETPLKNRRLLRGNFLDSWLNRDGEKDEDDDDDSEESIGKTRSERWRNKLRNIFRFGGLVSLELVPKEPSNKELPTDQPRTTLIEQQVEKPAAEVSQMKPAVEGLLTVSHEDQQPNYDLEDSDVEASSLQVTGPEIVPELEAVEVDYIDSEQPQIAERAAADTANQAESELGQAVSATSPNIDPASRPNSTVPVSEVLRRRQAERLEKKVKKLKRETKTIKREQAEVKEQQQDFAKKLEERQKAQTRFEKVTVPKMEKARQELKKRLETTPERPTPPVEVRQEKPEVKAIIPETSKQPLEIKSEYTPEAKQTVRTEQLAKPEAISVPNLEVMPEPTIVSEKLYDRRREVKDLAGYQPTNASLATSQIGRTPVPNVPPPLVGPMLPNPSATIPDQPRPIAPKNNDMYKQAAKNGFLTGIIMLVLLMLILLLMRL